MPSRRPPRPRRALVGTLAMSALITTTYYLLPGTLSLPPGEWTVLYVCGISILTMAILLLGTRLLGAGPGARLNGLVAVLCVAVVFFAQAYLLLAKDGGQFAGLHTRTDALYFTMSTLSTIGFGDVHATGQVARAAVTGQIVFDLVILGFGVATVTTMLRARAGLRTSRPDGAVAGPARDDNDDQAGS
jgi:voltage-gated potassium channel